MRMVDADKLVEAFNAHKIMVDGWIPKTVFGIPIIDAEPVVRCRDCKYLGIKDFVYGYCKKDMNGIIHPDDYCSKGKRG